MTRIIYPGFDGQPCQADCIIVINNEEGIPKATIIAYQDDRHVPYTSLVNTDTGRNLVLNRVLESELQGVRIDLIQFVVVIGDYLGKELHGFDFPIRFDLEDYAARGNPHEIVGSPASNVAGSFLKLIGKGDKQIHALARNIVGGSTRVSTYLEEAKSPNLTEIRKMLISHGLLSD